MKNAIPIIAIIMVFAIIFAISLQYKNAAYEGSRNQTSDFGTRDPKNLSLLMSAWESSLRRKPTSGLLMKY